MKLQVNTKDRRQKSGGVSAVSSPREARSPSGRDGCRPVQVAFAGVGGAQLGTQRTARGAGHRAVEPKVLVLPPSLPACNEMAWG